MDHAEIPRLVTVKFNRCISLSMLCMNEARDNTARGIDGLVYSQCDYIRTLEPQLSLGRLENTSCYHYWPVSWDVYCSQPLSSRPMDRDHR